MARGRKPKASHLHVVDGTFRADRANEHEPQAFGDVGDAPPELLPAQRLLWQQLLRDAPEFVLKACDREAFRTLVAHVWTMREAERQMRDAPMLIIKTKQGNYIQNPLLGVFNSAAKHFMRTAAELGFTPVARARIIASDGKEADPVAAEYLR
jgi:P27 family predicted phage terminase small subunit